ncbi:hypothetical protein PVAG01_01978 [Phlyctema vagabunda]|uniref:Uncharacterized protein n=1 Tax=Phlyctema vagabunda TaxID=108571 RepID=A0ABR4PYW8_9HELO
MMLSSLTKSTSKDSSYKDMHDLSIIENSGGSSTFQMSSRSKLQTEKMQRDEGSFDVIESDNFGSDISSNDEFVDVKMEMENLEKEGYASSCQLSEHSNDKHTSKAMKSERSTISNENQKGYPTKSREAKSHTLVRSCTDDGGSRKRGRVGGAIFKALGLAGTAYNHTLALTWCKNKIKRANSDRGVDDVNAAANRELQKIEFPPTLTAHHLKDEMICTAEVPETVALMAKSQD